jgi:hypothetical protein
MLPTIVDSPPFWGFPLLWSLVVTCVVAAALAVTAVRDLLRFALSNK